MSTLFHDITRLLERTYASAGVALEDCIIHGERCARDSEAMHVPERGRASACRDTLVLRGMRRPPCPTVDAIRAAAFAHDPA